MDLHAPPAAPPADASAHGQEGGGHHANYYRVFMILFVVTVLEVIVGISALPRWLKAPALVAMALYKAILVAMEFMHLKFERKSMWVVASAPLIFGVILSIGAYPDSERSTEARKHGRLPTEPVPASLDFIEKR
jgi:caa(3)-type oxidase subunit IV